MATPNEAGGWVIDPSNPNRATYTDEDGQTHEAFKEAPTAAPTSTPITPNTPTSVEPETRGAFRRMGDSYEEAAQHGFPGLVARKWYDWTDYGVKDLIKKGYSPEQAESMADELIGTAQKGLRADMAARQAADPNWKPDESFWSAAGDIGKWGPWLAGQVLGSAGPESLINPGGSAVARIGAQAGVGAASDVAYQGADIADNAADSYDPSQTLLSGLTSAGLQGVFEVPGFLKGLFKGGADAPSIHPETSAPDVSLDEGGRLDLQDLPGDKISDVVTSGSDPVEARLADEANRFLSRKTQGDGQPLHVEIRGNAPAVPARTDLEGTVTGDKIDHAVSRINELTKDWTNAPQYEVHANLDHMPDIDPTAVGVLTPEGKVLINMKNVDSPDVLSAVTFHEGLGHHGLAQKFNDELPRVMEDLYTNSKGNFAQKVDDWISKNPDYYPEGTPNRQALAVEEVLAEMSNKGPLKRGLLDPVKDYIKNLGREMGLDLKYSDREIRSILAMAHDATINGSPSAVENGFRYKKVDKDDAQSFLEYSNATSTRPSKLFNELEEGASPDAASYIDFRNKQLGVGQEKEFRYKLSEADREKRSEQSLAATRELIKTQKGETKSVRPFPEEEPDYHRFRHVTEDGKIITGMYTVNDGKLDNFSVSSDDGVRAIGPKVVRQIGRDLLKQHPGASRISGYRISGSRGLSGAEFVESGSRFMKKRPEGQKENVGAINPNKIGTVADIDEMLYELNAVSPNRKTTWEETEAEALARGLTPSRIAKRKGLEGASSYIRAANIALTQQIENVAKIEKKISEEGYSVKLHEQMLTEMARLKAVHARVNHDNSELGRALNILRKASSSKELAQGVTNAFEGVNNNLLSDPGEFMKFMKLVSSQLAAGNDAGATKLIAAAFKPGAEHYIFKMWYNMLLSSPATHVANFAGTGGNFVADLLENTGAAVTGQFKRNNLDRVRGREVAYRVFGALQALKSAQTWKNTRESLNTGHTGGEGNSKGGSSQVYTGDNPVIGAASGLMESPSRALAGADEWWRNVLQLSNMYGLAVRNAGNKGLKGKEFWNEARELINNPTKEMIDATNDYTKVIQFLDKPSEFGNMIIGLQTPKVNSSPVGRVARGVLKAAVPFVRTPDSLIRTAIRRTPLGAFERENIKGWKAGGAERDKVKARLIMGSMISFWLASQAYKGDITGEGPSDYKKKAEWLGSHQPNSIKVGDKWYSIAGLEPVSTNINGIATLVERHKAGELSDEDYVKSALSLTQGIGAVLTQNSYLEGFQNLTKINDSDTNTAVNGLQEFMTNVASSATTPAILRKYTQAQDTAVRDTTGSGSFKDRLYGRIASALPGLSDQLPQRYDVYGRGQERNFAGPDLASRTQTRMEEDDPVIQELSRLSDSTSKVLVGQPGKSKVKVNGVEKRLNAEEFQKYQHLSGYWIVEAIRNEMKSPEWTKMSDADKIDLLTNKNDGIVTQMREAAREYLFNPDGDEPDTEEDEE